MRQLPVFFLPVVHIPHIFLCKRRIVKKICRSVEENLRVARPAVAFAGRAICGQVGVVVLGIPDGVFNKLIEKCVGAFKKPVRSMSDYTAMTAKSSD